jgi:hypothetical protein
VKLSSCEDTRHESVYVVAGYAVTIKAVEERIAEYEIGKRNRHEIINTIDRRQSAEYPGKQSAGF